MRHERRGEGNSDLDIAEHQLLIESHLGTLVHRVPSVSPHLLSRYIVLDLDIFMSKCVNRAIDCGDPVIGPPVLEADRE
jgi:hypothetical protein